MLSRHYRAVSAVCQPAPEPGSSLARVASQGVANASSRKEISSSVTKPSAPVEAQQKSQHSRPIGDHSGPDVPDVHRHTQELSITVSPPANEAAPNKIPPHDPQSLEAGSGQTNRGLTIDNGPDIPTAASNERTQGVETFISKTTHHVCIVVIAKFRTGAGSRTPDTPSVTSNNASANSVINPLKDTQEELFLLRHYSECIAPWYGLGLPKKSPDSDPNVLGWIYRIVMKFLVAKFSVWHANILICDMLPVPLLLGNRDK